MLRRFFCKLLVVIVIFSLLALSGTVLAQGRSEGAFEHVKAVQERYTKGLMAKPGVVGTAVGLNGKGKHDVIVLLENDSVPGIPQELEDVPVRLLVTGKIFALVKPDNPGHSHGHGGGKSPKPSDWWPRPIPIGISTGNGNECSAGTIGCRVTDGTDVYALSNNHVYARENDAQTGEEVLQPGLFDTHCIYDSDNVIGALYVFEPIVFSEEAENVVDAAIASTTTDDVNNTTPSDGYGVPNSETATAETGQNVQKYGRTTGLTKGIVYAVNAELSINYDAGTAHFVHQIVVYSSKGPFVRAGDSGSLAVTDDESKNPIGLVFAGNSSGHFAFANPIDDVLDAFGVSIDGE